MFEVGKKVICIKSHSDGHYKKGEVYPLDAIKKGCSHYPVLLSIRIRINGFVVCESCSSNFGCDTHWANASNFAPYDDSLSDHTIESILEEIETEQLQTE